LSRTDLSDGHRFYTDSEVDAVISAAAIPIDLLNSQTLHFRSTDGLDLIEVMVPRHIALIECLEDTARCLHFDRQGQPASSLSGIAKKMAVIAKAAEGLRVALGLQQNCDIPPQEIRARLSLAARREAEGNSDPKIRYGETGQPIRCIVGTHPDGSPLYSYLCRKPIEFYREGPSDQALLDAIKGVECIARWAKDAEADILWRTKGNFAKGRKANHAVNNWIQLLGNVWRHVLKREPGTSVVVTGVDETRADGANETQADGPFVRFLATAAMPLSIKMTNEAFRDCARRIFKNKGKLGRN
jgi:hypothetical protein